jgi:epoxyqueuosine reductase QueG
VFKISNKKQLNLTEKIKNYLYQMEMAVVGVASVENELFNEAPKKHHPKNILENAKSVIIFGKPMPKSVLKVANYKKQLVHRTYHSLYKYLDIVATRLSCYLESLGFYSVPVPSYIPLSIENLEPWGIISLKHAGAAAGVGTIANNGLLIHPEYGTLLRLSGVITTADLDSTKMFKEEICKDCNLCISACPANAFSKRGKFRKLNCLNSVVKHGFNVFHPLQTEEYLKNVELISNTVLLEYSVGCTKCLEVCPLNKKELPS